ncbi:MAG TPA: phage capsid protein [Vineibacter sp.]|nr:phage capsid protein [Vineibacter sp.]
MADTAFQTQYLQEHIQSFERRQSALRDMVSSKAEIRGNVAVFLVAGSGGANAVTRGVNGKIPGRADDLNQLSCTLSEWHDVVERTSVNIFASQGNQRQIMQETTMAVVNRKIDQQIITELETGTNDTGAAQPGSLNLVAYAKTILGNNNAGGGRICAAITPAFHGYLMQIPEFGSADYRATEPFEKTTNEQAMEKFRWYGVDFVVHTGLTGLGTAAEKCLFWNVKAIGHAADTGNMKSMVDYDGRHDFSWARCSIFMGAKLLQNAGVVVVNHDGSAFAAQ